MAEIARKVRLTGRVQGVFFRAWTQDRARELGVNGWVRNCADGSVEAQLTGEEDAVARMIERLRSGPSNARVEDVLVEDSEPGTVGRFEVRRN